jgi:spermidine/putrescine transport system substrate-binding protein
MAAVAFATLAFTGCGKKTTAEADAATAAKPQELNLYIWTEYIDPDIITQFEKEYNCKVVMSLYESNEEMLAKLQAGGVSQYDLVVPSDFIMESLINLNLLQPIDHALVPNIVNLKDNFVNPPFDPGNKYTVAWQWGTVGIVYSKAKFPHGVTSWKDILEPAPDIKFMFFDSEREMIGAALRYKGYSVNSMNKEELMDAAILMIADKKLPGFMGFEGNVGGRNKVIAGTVDIAMAYNGDVIQSMAEDESISFCNPKEGTVVWVDSLCIPREAPNPKLAMKFMNYILQADIGAQLSNFNQFATPNKASLPLITPDDLANPAIYPNAETEKNLEYVLELPDSSALFGELWKTVKTR